MLAKQAKLKPKQLRGKWSVNVPKHLSDTGKRRQLFFDSKETAQTYCEQLKIRRDNFGGSLTSMSPARIAECAEALKMLDPIGVSLLDAVREYVAGHNRRNQSITFEQLFNEYIATRVKAHAKYLKSLRLTKERFPSLQSKIVSDLQTKEIESALAGITDGARNAFLRAMRTVLNHGIDRGYLKDNPVRKSSFAERPEYDREVIPADKVATIFNFALENNPEIVPYLVVTFFCGVRPQDEALELKWTNIDSTSLAVPYKVSKTEDVRVIELSTNAKAWLKASVDRTGVTTGKIMPLTSNQLSTRRIAAYKAAGYSKIPQDAARHSFASYWLPVNGNDFGELLSRMGHSDIATLRKHYLRHAPEVDAKAFWSIVPPDEVSKIIQMTAAS